MERCILELKVLSCRDLKAFNFFHKLSVYAVVCVVDEQVKKEQLQRQKTPVSREGGSPEWNHSLHFHLKGMSYPERAERLFLKFELRSEGGVFGNKIIGNVSVPLENLIDDFSSSARFVSYEVRSRDGKANGVLNFSYKLIGRETEKRVELEEKSVDDDEQMKLPKMRLYPCLDDILCPLPPIPCPLTTHLPSTYNFDAFQSVVHANEVSLLQVPASDLSYRQYHYQWPGCNTNERINTCNYHLNVRE